MQGALSIICGGQEALGSRNYDSIMNCRRPYDHVSPLENRVGEKEQMGPPWEPIRVRRSSPGLPCPPALRVCTDAGSVPPPPPSPSQAPCEWLDWTRCSVQQRYYALEDAHVEKSWFESRVFPFSKRKHSSSGKMTCAWVAQLCGCQASFPTGWFSKCVPWSPWVH